MAASHQAQGIIYAVKNGDYCDCRLQSITGYMENTDYNYGNLFIQSSFNDSLLGNWDLQIGGQIKNFGSNSFYSLNYPTQFEATKTLLTTLSWNKRIGQFEIAASAFYRRHYDRLELFREGVADFLSGTTGHNYLLTDVNRINFKVHGFHASAPPSA